jgi:hypothetical protein
MRRRWTRSEQRRKQGHDDPNDGSTHNPDVGDRAHDAKG